MRIHPDLELNADLAKNFLEHLSHLDRLAGAEVDDLRFLGRTGYCPESRSHGVDIEKISNRVQIAGGEECSPGVCCGQRLASKPRRSKSAGHSWSDNVEKPDHSRSLAAPPRDQGDARLRQLRNAILIHRALTGGLADGLWAQVTILRR